MTTWFSSTMTGARVCCLPKARSLRVNVAARSLRADLGDLGLGRIVVLQLGLEVVGVPIDDGEQIIKVMRNSPGQLADAFQLLYVAQLIFQRRLPLVAAVAIVEAPMA